MVFSRERWRERETLGVVREWDEEEGFGVIDSDFTPGGVGTVFAVIEVDGTATKHFARGSGFDSTSAKSSRTATHIKQQRFFHSAET